MATWVSDTAITSAYNSSAEYNIAGGYGTVSRSGNTISFSFGIRVTRTTDAYTTNSFAVRYGNDTGGTMRYVMSKAGGSSGAVRNTTYYAYDGTKRLWTSEAIPYTYSTTVSGTGAGAVTVTVGWTDRLTTPSASSGTWSSYSFVVPYPSGFTNPSWSTYTVNSFPATAYVNMPYTYNIALGCNYGSSTSQNLLYWEGYAGSHGVIMVQTTGTSIAAGTRSYTFSNSDIGSYNFRGVIRYYNGGTQYMVHGTTYPLTVSFLNPSISGVSNVLNATNFYRTSTVSATTSATVTSNSGAPTAYVYFSSADAPGDSSGTGFYKIASYNAATTNSFSNVTKSYSHPGNKPGTFYARLSLHSNNASGTWTEFATPGQVSYVMHEFVVPTATRTATYNKHNVYTGQTKFPVTINVTAVSKSQYDTLTPTMETYVVHDGLRQLNVNLTNNWAVGTYNQTMNNSYVKPAVGDTISFINDLKYKDALNADAKTSVSSTNYVVKAIPQPNASEIGISISNNEIKKTITAGVTGNFDSDFVGQYTLYLENASGTTIYAQTSGTIGYDNYVEHTFTYNGSVSENYKVRMVANFALADEVNVKGTSFTSYSSTIRIIGGTKIYIKHDGENYDKLLPIDVDECPKPRLAFKYGDTIKYVPLYTDTPSAGTKQLWVRQGGTDYYTLLNTQFGSLYPSDDLYPEGNELSYEDLTAFTHQFLSNYTHQQIHDGDIE